MGWQMHVPAFIHLLPELPPVRFNCALLQFLSAVSLLFVNLESPKLARACALLLIGLASLFLTQIVFEVNLGVDALFHSASTFASDLHPGRISFSGAVGFMLVGFAAYLFTLPPSKYWVGFAVSLTGSLCVAIGVSAAFALAVGLKDPGVWSRFNGVTPQGALFFSLIGLGINWQLWTLKARRRSCLPRWAPVPVAIALITGTFILVEAVLPDQNELPLLKQTVPYLLLAAGIVTTALCSILVYQYEKVLREVKRRRAAEMRLRFQAAQTQLATIAKYSDDAIYSIALDGSILAWNRGAEKLYGYSAKEMIGDLIFKLSPPDQAGAVKTAIERVKQEGALTNYEAWRVRKDGESLLISFTVSPVYGPKRQMVSLSIIARDITEKKRSQEQIERLAQDLARSNQELEQFASIASHDIQEPLRMVSSYLTLLDNRYREQLDGEAREFIHFAVDGASRMKALVQGLLHYSRVGSQTLRVGEVCVSTVVRQAMLNLQEAIREAKAKVLVLGVLPTVAADEIQLVQIFQNLIANAIKFRRKSGPEVTISFKEENGELIFAVADNGIGIDPVAKDRIFTLFQRLHPRDKYPGVGIGLATCKKIVERHGGRIWVESQPNTGSTFLFSLPT